MVKQNVVPVVVLCREVFAAIVVRARPAVLLRDMLHQCSIRFKPEFLFVTVRMTAYPFGVDNVVYSIMGSNLVPFVEGTAARPACQLAPILISLV